MKELHGFASTVVSASPRECYSLLLAVDRYPSWYPEVVRETVVVERDENGSPTAVRATLNVAAGPLVRQFRVLLAVRAVPSEVVELSRIPHDPSDHEAFAVSWRLRANAAGAGTRIELALDANLSVPRLLPVGGIGDSLAQGFVTAAAAAIDEDATGPGRRS
jgi:ribosome-associated toxin RatA of RatAB toxin-antitoxin module